MSLQLTDAGRAAIADGANRGTAAVTFTAMALGDGRSAMGDDDSARAALRNERVRENVVGTAPTPTRMALRATFLDSQEWQATEIGIFARIGAGAEFLAAYCAVGAGDAALVGVTANTNVVVAAVLDLVSSPAEVAVTVSPTINVSGGAVPPGTVVMTAAAAAPATWLLCDGAAVSRTTYASLFREIGSAYGGGDGATTFNVPDFRGRVPVGVGNGTGLTNRSRAEKGGAEGHSLTGNELASHEHAAGSLAADAAGGHDHALNEATDSDTGTRLEAGTFYFSISAISRNANQILGRSSQRGPINDDGVHGHAVSGRTASSGAGAAHPNMQPWLALNYIIKT